MPNIIVCYKWVPDEQDIRVNPATKEVNAAEAKYKISDYDRNAVEAGAKLFEERGGSLRALSFGTADLKASLKDVLSRGPESVTWIADDSAKQADASVTARVLAAAIGRMGQPDIVLCGDGSADQYSQQVAPRLAVLLDVPMLGSVESFTWNEDGSVSALRQLRDSLETVTVAAPLVISVLPSINQARIPGLKQIMAAGRKPMEALVPDDLGLGADELRPRCREISLQAALFERRNVVFKEAGAEANVAALAAALRADGVL